ncbi:MAG: hypothetical protein K2Z81_17840 [Cyanobacteria bacterium]|nr:hypothetical protein [Cyanobacteriota bacterium]
MSSEPVDIWKRLKKLSRIRIKICGRIRRLNLVINHRTVKLQQIGRKYTLISAFLELRRDELSEEQIDLLLDMMVHYGKRIDQLTEDIGDLAEPSSELFRELDDVENQITALEAIVEAEVSSSD